MQRIANPSTPVRFRPQPQLLKKMKKEEPMLILAGGLGTRLKPSLKDLPKALAPVEGKPFLEIILDHWKSQGIRDFIFLLGYKAKDIIFILEDLNSKNFKDCTFKFVVEKYQLGTGGAVINALNELKIKSNFYLINADTWLEINISDIPKNLVPCICLIEHETISRYGQVEINKEMRVLEFKEKEESSSSGLINSGLYYLQPEDFLKRSIKKLSIERDIFPELIDKGKLNSCILDSTFIDIGVPEDYETFKNYYKKLIHDYK